MLSVSDKQHIPEILVGCQRYHPNTAEGYDALYRWLVQQPKVLKPELGAIRLLPSAGRSPGGPNDFREMCRRIRPLFEENARIFKDFGPNSGAASASPLRSNLESWYHMRSKRIVPNNREIAALVKISYSLIPAEHRRIFDKLLSHIEAFELHVGDENINYSDKQFPAAIVSLVEEMAYQK
jgi:hypothetical protein